MSERQSADWMCPLDERIMELLDKEGWSTPQLIEQAMSMNASERRVAERLRMLSEVELIAPLFEGSNMYELTGEGKRYLGGDLDAAKHIDQPNPNLI